MPRELNPGEVVEPRTDAEILALSVEYIKGYIGGIEGFEVQIEKTDLPIVGSENITGGATLSAENLQEQMAMVIAPLREIQSRVAEVSSPDNSIQIQVQKILAPIQELQSRIAKATSPAIEIQEQMARMLTPIQEMQNKLTEALVPIQALQIQLAKAMAPVQTAQNQLVENTRFALRKLDGVLQVKAPNQQVARFAVEVKRSLEVRDLPQIVRQIEATTQAIDSKLEPMVVARYISKSAQQWLRKQQISYVDATGNFLMSSRLTGTFLFSESGAKQDPWRMPGRPRNTFKGASVVPIFRALIDFSPPYSIPELMKLANSSSGVTYRVIDFLEREGLVTLKDDSKGGKEIRRITNVDWKKLLSSWSAQYSFQQDNSVSNFLEPRGIQEVLRKLNEVDPSQYLITGSVAAEEIEPYSISKQITIYSKYPSDLAKALALRPTQAGTNVQLISPYSEGVFARPNFIRGINFAAPSQIALDLLSGPGRNASEGEAIINWMSKNERRWRK